MGQEILTGVIDVKPYADKNGSACDYCDFQDVCGFDRKIPGMCEKKGGTISPNEAWERIVSEAPDSEE